MKTQFTVPDMSCQHCVAAVTGGLMELTGVSGVVIDLDSKLVDVDHDPSATREAMVAAIEGQGFEVAS